MSERDPTRLERLCRHPRLVPGLLVAVAIACLPALWVGYQADDWLQQAILRGQNVMPGLDDPIMDLFTFMDGDRAHNARLVDLGAAPWWAPADLKLQFWRPLTALTHMLDHRVAPGAAAVAHAHSIVWLLVLVWLAGRLYRRVHTGPRGLAVAGLATVIYAIDESHGFPVSWIANRNVLIAGALGVGALLTCIRGARDDWRPGRALTPALLGLALLAGEAAIATLGWLAAYAICLDRRPWPARLRSLAAPTAVVVVWRVAYSAMGYGASGSGFYIDPVAAPVAFLAELPGRLIALLGDQLVNLPSIAGAFAGPLEHRLMLAVAALALAAVGLCLRRPLRRSAEARFWGLGMLLSAIPLCATVPAGRLLIFVGIGGAGLIAALIEQTLWQAPERRWPLVSAIAALHLIVAPALLPVQARGARAVGEALINPCERAVPRDPSIAGRTVVFVNGNDLCTGNQVYQRVVQGTPAPRAIRLLAHGLYDIEVWGIDGHTIELAIAQGMQSAPVDRLLRADGPWARPGDVIALPESRITIRSVDDRGRVDRIRVRFDAPLRDPSLVWQATRALTPVPFEPPAPGECTSLPGAFGWMRLGPVAAPCQRAAP